MAAGAAGTDVRQLLLQVDASVSLAQRGLSQLAAQVARETGQMESNLERPAIAAERMGARFNQIARGTTASLGQMRAASQQLSFQIGDVAQGFALGTKPMTIFAQQSGQVIQAITLMGGASNKFLTFLGGPWGAVISGATIILGTLISKMSEGSSEIDKAVEKLRKQAEQTKANEEADRIWKNTIEGVTEAIRKRREEQERSLQTAIQAEQESLNEARRELETIERQRERTARELQVAKVELSNLRKAPAAGPGEAALRPGQIAAAEQRVDQLRKQLANAIQQIRNAEAAIRSAEIPIDERAVKASLDPVVAATDAYTRALGRLRKERDAGKISREEYRRQLALEEKALKAAEDAARTNSTNRQSGRQVSGEEAAAIARAAGLQVNSVGRTFAQQKALYDQWVASGMPADNPVARPGTSAHEGARGKWAIDIQITDGVTPGKIRSIYAQQGINLSKVLKERGHFHIEGSRSEAAAAERIEDRAEAEERRNIAGLLQDVSRTEEQVLQARVQAAETAEEQKLAELALLNHQYERLKEEISLVAVTSAEGKAAKESAQIAIDIRYEQQRTLINQKAVNRAADEQVRSLTHSLGLRRDDLQGQLALARTQSERRRLELEMLDIAYRIREAELRRAEAAARLAGNIEEANRIQEEINALPERRRQDEERTRRDTQGPLAEWADTVPQDAAEINEALESIAARGLDNLADALTEVVMGTKSLGDAFKDIAASIVADITKMIIKMLIFRALSQAFAGIFGGAGGGAGLMPTSGSGLPDIFSGGMPYLPGRAAGGPVWAGTAYRVGERGPETIIPRENGMVIPGGYGGRGRDELMVTVAASEDFEVKVERRAQKVVADAAPHIVAASQQRTVRTLQRHRLP